MAKSANIETKCKICEKPVFINKSRAEWGGMNNSYCKQCAIRKANKGFSID
jgi:hypothetical protein